MCKALVVFHLSGDKPHKRELKNTLGGMARGDRTRIRESVRCRPATNGFNGSIVHHRLVKFASMRVTTWLFLARGNGHVHAATMSYEKFAVTL